MTHDTLHPTTAGTSVELSHLKCLLFVCVCFLQIAVCWSHKQSLSLLPTSSCAASLLPLVLFHHAVIQTRKGNDQYLLNEVSIPTSLLNAAHGCPGAASVCDFIGCLYNFSQLLFLRGPHTALLNLTAESQSIYKEEKEFDYTS